MRVGDFRPQDWMPDVDIWVQIQKHRLWHHPIPSGQLHEPSTQRMKQSLRRASRWAYRRALVNRAREFWWRVRRPLRVIGGCQE